VVKIDVEGHEVELLKGGRNFFCSQVDSIIIEVSLQRDTSWQDQSVISVFNLLNDYGFSLVNVFDVYSGSDHDMMLKQMDCVFRHRSKLPSPCDSADDR
jgi:hypothetical protein